MLLVRHSDLSTIGIKPGLKQTTQSTLRLIEAQHQALPKRNANHKLLMSLTLKFNNFRLN